MRAVGTPSADTMHGHGARSFAQPLELCNHGKATQTTPILPCNALNKPPLKRTMPHICHRAYMMHTHAQYNTQQFMEWQATRTTGKIVFTNDAAGPPQRIPPIPHRSAD